MADTDKLKSLQQRFINYSLKIFYKIGLDA